MLWRWVQVLKKRMKTCQVDAKDINIALLALVCIYGCHLSCAKYRDRTGAMASMKHDASPGA